MIAPHVEEDYDDIVQIFRVKAWRALESFDATRSRLPVHRYVFGCITNQSKDLVKKKKRAELYIEDVNAPRGDESRADQFVARYLSADHIEIFGGVDEGSPLIPSTLTDIERQVICLLYSDYAQTEVARSLGLTRSRMERTMESIRTKMADWAPPEPSLAVAA